MADLLLTDLAGQRFEWGRGSLVQATELRAQYIGALRAADSGDIRPLLVFLEITCGHAHLAIVAATQWLPSCPGYPLSPSFCARSTPVKGTQYFEFADTTSDDAIEQGAPFCNILAENIRKP